MYRLGPLRVQWCMRFEAKNHFIKMRVGLNFKNVPKSVAHQHQYYMCLQLLSSQSNFLYKGEKIGQGMFDGNTSYGNTSYLLAYLLAI